MRHQSLALLRSGRPMSSRRGLLAFLLTIVKTYWRED
jgi:hypothetical protein